MSSIEHTEEEKRILAWAKKNHAVPNILSPSQKDSFFSPFENTGNVMAYGFNTVPELKARLDEMWKDDDVMREISLVCAIAAFKEYKKRKEEMSGDSHQNTSDDRFEIPDYIYTF